MFIIYKIIYFFIFYCIYLKINASNNIININNNSNLPYRCVMRGICGNNGQLYQNCAYNGPPLPVPYGDDYYYRELCPQLFLG